MTPAERIAAILEEAERLELEATEGWTLMDVPPPSRDDPGWRAIARCNMRMVGVPAQEQWKDGTKPSDHHEPDLAFIAAARTGWPRAVKALQGILTLTELDQCNPGVVEFANEIQERIAVILEGDEP